MRPNRALKILSVIIFIISALLFKSCCESTDEYFDLPQYELIMFNDGDTIIYSSYNFEYKDTFKLKVKLYYESNYQDCGWCSCGEYYQTQWVRYFELADSNEEVGSHRHHYEVNYFDHIRFKGLVENSREGIILPEFTINQKTYKNVIAYNNLDTITVDSTVIRKLWHNYQYGIISYVYLNGDTFYIDN